MVNNKVCIVTGAAVGVGLGASEVLAEDGAKVIMTDIAEEKLMAEAKRLDSDCYKADLTDRRACKALVDYVMGKYSRVDILVNVASIQTISPIDEFPEDKWDYMISLMLTAPFLLTRYVWPSMKNNNWGRIVHHNSIHGLVASEFRAAYVSAKHGLSGLTKVSALEGGKYGITVNSICSSYVRTPMFENQIADLARINSISEEEVIEKIVLQKAAIKRLHEPKEIGEIIKFFCSDAAIGITGTTFTVDCGWTAG
ncbi:MAG: 3-hydroxybutyrate dehydrogenase [Bacillota bacterium]|nr:3-hydroxybutyrate dehydrogenase [Bacillota bacterium]